MRLGDSGLAVAEVRARLARLGLLDDPNYSQLEPGGVFDTVVIQHAVFDDDLDRAVRQFQQDRGLTVDGIVGKETFRRLEEARWRLGDRVLSFTPGHLMAGEDVAELQRRLTRLGFDSGRADGAFGRQTDNALREFQRSVGVEADGTCGMETFKAFERLSRAITGGEADALREQAALDAVRSGLADKVVVLDAGHGGPDGGVGGHDLLESEVSFDIVGRIEGRIAALGTQVVLTRGAHLDSELEEIERAQLANHTNADLLVSIHADSSTSPTAQGVVSYYYGDPISNHHSITGKAFAEYVQEEVCKRTGAVDCHSHARAWDLLRRTKMPAVRIEVGYLTCPDEATRLADPAYRDHIAEGIATAIIRFFAPH